MTEPVATTINRCHVKHCTNEQIILNWHPQVQCCIGICEAHNTLPPEERNELIIDLERAQNDHKAAFNDATSIPNDPEEGATAAPPDE